MPAIVSGWMVALTLSIDDLAISTGLGANTLLIQIYALIRLGGKPQFNAVCRLLIAIVGTGVIITSIATKRASSAR